MTNEELENKIKDLEEELKNTKVNKRTEGAVGLLKAKIAKLKEQLEKENLKSSSKKGVGYAVKKEGDVTIGLLGKPSVGKSTLLSNLTNKESKIGAYEFTTLDVTPGLLHYNFTNLQILDLPGVIDRASDNRGFGKKVLSVVRVCDLVVFVIDVKNSINEMKMLLRETYNSKIRVNKKPPEIIINRTHNKGINITSNFSQETLKNELIKRVLIENKIINCEIQINEKNLGVEDLLEVIYKSVEYTKGVICLNKIDMIEKEELEKIENELKKEFSNWRIFKISAYKKLFLEEFKEFLWRQLNLIFIYLKEPRKDVNFEKPLIVKKDSTILDVVKAIHNDFVSKFKYANLKGKSAKFDWQRVGLNHKVLDKDVVEFYFG